MRNILLSGLLLCTCLIRVDAEGKPQNVLIGVLEDDRSELKNWKKGPSKNRVIQPLFEKKADEWIVSPLQPEDFVWTIAFDGKNRGGLTNRPQAKNNLLNADSSPGTTLTIGKPSVDFSGWMNTPVNRPLVLVSNGGFNDPELWKPYQLSGDQIKQVKAAFAATYPKVLNCDENEKALPNPWRYKHSDISIEKTYGSAKGEYLVSMFLKGGKCGINEAPFREQWFLFRPDKTSRHLRPGQGTVQTENFHPADRLRSMTLIDAGDYDSDGRSEVLFFVSGYNEDGYALFYSSFTKSVMWAWSYH